MLGEALHCESPEMGGAVSYGLRHKRVFVSVAVGHYAATVWIRDTMASGWTYYDDFSSKNDKRWYVFLIEESTELSGFAL